MRSIIALALVVAAAVAPAKPAASPSFDPVDFFRGRTHGEGTLKAIFQRSKRISVDSLGTEQADGTLLLKQVVREEGKAARTRYWRMRREAGGGYSGTLTDAVGPVRVTVDGNAIRIRYTDKDHLDFDQRLTASGPTVVHNQMKVRRFGITVAHFDEVIRKLD